MEGAAKVAVVLDRLSIGEATKTPGVIRPLEGVDPIEVSSDLSP